MARHYTPELKTLFDGFFLALPNVKTGQMFGHPNYKIEGKTFAFLVEGGIALKLPLDVVAELLTQDNTALFAPGGMPMKRWVQIFLPDGTDYKRYDPYYQQAIEHVLEEVAREKK